MYFFLSTEFVVEIKQKNAAINYRLFKDPSRIKKKIFLSLLPEVGQSEFQFSKIYDAF